MKQWSRRAPLVAGLVFALVVGAVALAPAEWHARYSGTMNAPPAVIQAILHTRGGWARLQKHVHKDDRTFVVEPGGDPDRGAGMRAVWRGAGGQQALTLGEVSPTGLTYTIADTTTGSTISGEISLTPTPEGTTLTWTEEGPIDGGALGGLIHRADTAAILRRHEEKAEVLKQIVEADAAEARVLEQAMNPGP